MVSQLFPGLFWFDHLDRLKIVLPDRGTIPENKPVNYHLYFRAYSVQYWLHIIIIRCN